MVPYEVAHKEGEALSYSLFALTKLCRHWAARKAAVDEKSWMALPPKLVHKDGTLTTAGLRFFHPTGAVDMANYTPPRLPEKVEARLSQRRSLLVAACIAVLTGHVAENDPDREYVK